MNHLELLQSWTVFAFEVALCAFVFARGLQRLLPFFAAYAAIMLTCTIAVGLVYEHFGFRSTLSYYAYWIETLLNMIARSVAIAELCRYGLREFKGIWTLAWRTLTGLAVLSFVNAAFDAWGQPNRLAIYGLTLDRDFELASIAILVALLLIRRYYGIILEQLQRDIAIGICFFCAADVINGTVLRNMYTGDLSSWFLTNFMPLWPSLRPYVERVNELYGAIRLSVFMISMGIWCYALRKPLPAPAAPPDLLPEEIYGALSPALNVRLRAFNDRLEEMLKI